MSTLGVCLLVQKIKQLVQSGNVQAGTAGICMQSLPAFQLSLLTLSAKKLLDHSW